MKNKKFLTIMVIVVIVLAALVCGRMVNSEEEYDEILPPTVEVQAPKVGDIAISSSLIGKIEPADVVYINSDLGGEITSVGVKAGDTVVAGQVLCTLENKQLETVGLNVEAANLAYTNALTAYERMKVLYENGAVSLENFESVQTGLEQARIQYESAKNAYDLQAENTIIVSPISGKVESCSIEVFDKVSPQNILFVVSGEDTDKVVNFSVTENVVKGLAEGDTIRIEKSGKNYKGLITEVSTMVNMSTGLFDVKAMVEDGETLATGTSAKIYVTSDKVTDVLTVPTDAVYYSNGEAFVYTYVEGKAQQVFVEVGLQDQENAEIIKGLSTTDLVITTWSSELYDDAEVVLKKTEAKDKKAETSTKETIDKAEDKAE